MASLACLDVIVPFAYGAVTFTLIVVPQVVELILD
jgi:hypothetical protein